MTTARTHSRRSALFLGLLAAATLLVAPLPAAGTLQESNTDVDKARALETRAEGLLAQEDVSQWNKAADLFRQAAAHREEADGKKVADLRMASRLSAYVGRPLQAVDDAEAAARLALRQGDLVQAGHAYVDAAWLAADARQPQRSKQLVHEARLLANSPLLAQSVRTELLGRIQEAA